MKRMKAALLKEFGKPLAIEEVDTPKPGHGEVLIRVKAAGLCGTDVDIIDGHLSPPTMPLIPCHEIAGVVEEIGPAVKEVKEGDRVVLSWVGWTCGYCDYCQKGIENICVNVVNPGFTADGGFAEFVKASATHVLKIPDNVSFEEAACATCAVVTSYHALRYAYFPKLGDLLLISGPGGVGINAIQIAKSLGAKVVAVSRSEAKLTIAKELGADYVVSPLTSDPVRYIQDLGGADAALLFAPSGKAAEQAYYALKPGGTLVFITTTPEHISVPVLDWASREIRAVGSWAWTRQDLRGAMDLISRGEVRPRIEKYKFDEVNEVITKFREGKIIAARAIMVFG